MDRACKRSAMLIADSEATREDLKRFYHVPDDKIAVSLLWGRNRSSTRLRAKSRAVLSVRVDAAPS